MYIKVANGILFEKTNKTAMFNMNIQITAFLPPEVLPTEQYSCTMYMYFCMAFITHHFLTGQGILLLTASGGRGCGGVGGCGGVRFMGEK